jgi:hypothetical protein
MKWISDREPSEEIAYGQIVIITARWILLVSAWA